MLYSFIFLRHGRSLADDEKVYEGRYDSPLTNIGIDQASNTARLLVDKNIDHIITSPLKRAKDTAKSIGTIINAPVEELALLIERDNGILAGMKYEEAQEKYPEPLHKSIFRKFPQESGESIIDLEKRALSCISNLINRDPKKYLIISHGNILNAIVRCILNMPRQINVVFRFKDNGYIEMDYNKEKDIWIFKSMKEGF